MFADVLEQFLHFGLELAHLFSHVQDDFDPCEVDAEVAGQIQDDFQTIEIGVGVEARVAVTPRRLEQSQALVQAKRLRMNL